MQPETKTKEPVKETTPTEQWDAVAFKLIQQELAPKGFSEIKRGPWRGKVQSNIPFLPKTSVVNCQKIAAQIVRTFRGKTNQAITKRITHGQESIKESENRLKTISFWRVRKRMEIRRWIKYCQAVEVGLKIALNEIEQLGIK